MPEKMESLCKYLVGGEYCSFNKQNPDSIEPSGTYDFIVEKFFWDEDKEEYNPLEMKPRPHDLPPEGLEVCFLAQQISTINQIGRSQKHCDSFEQSDNPRPWEQVTPIPIKEYLIFPKPLKLSLH